MADRVVRELSKQDQVVVQSDAPVTILGGGAPRIEDIREALSFSTGLVAADGAAAEALAAGVTPDWVIGDMDSLDPETRARVPADRIVEVSEQESTDFEKCLTRIAAPVVLATGVTADRMDHALAALSVLVRFADRRVVVFDAHDVILAAPPDIALDLPPGARVSLFPMAPVTGRSEGLEWPIEGLSFAPDGRIGTSNRATGPVRLWFDGPGMLLILPRAALGSVLAALGVG